jgi:hypothetical protein
MGRWHSAEVDYRRATNGFPQYADAIERWHEVAANGREHTLLDMKTFDDSQPQAVRLWIKQRIGDADTHGPYSVQQYGA